VLADGGAGDLECGGDLSGRELALGDVLQDRAATRLS
jgi:hypothetical protein